MYVVYFDGHGCCGRAIPESLVWLIAKGRIADAETILERAANVNGKQLPAHCLGSDEEPDGVKMSRRNSSETHPNTQRTYTALDLVRTPNLRRITVCISGLW